MEAAKVIHLMIEVDGETVEFIILALEEATESVEFRRIVVRSKGRGIGQRALEALDAWFETSTRCRRIWLDVFASNERARHVYLKAGYTEVNRHPGARAELVYYEKVLNSASVSSAT